MFNFVYWLYDRKLKDIKVIDKKSLSNIWIYFQPILKKRVHIDIFPIHSFFYCIKDLGINWKSKEFLPHGQLKSLILTVKFWSENFDYQ